MRRWALGVALAFAVWPAGAQEIFEIGLSVDSISVGAQFEGAQFVVFGVLDEADSETLLRGGYDIAVALEGPRRQTVVRRRERFLGLWINRGAEEFTSLPISYSLATTRPLAEIAGLDVLRQLVVGVENLPYHAGDGAGAAREDYAEALRRLREGTGVYQEEGQVAFMSATLFRATIPLPPDIPVGRHVVRAYLFRDGEPVLNRSQGIWVRKTGFEASISQFAARNGVAYGFIAVALALGVGWFGRFLFKRD